MLQLFISKNTAHLPAEKNSSLRQYVQYGFPPLDSTAAEDDVGAGVGAGDETGREVSRITEGALPVFPPDLITLPGAMLAAEAGEFRLFAESNDMRGEACSGERVVVVGGRVSTGKVVVAGLVVTACPEGNDVLEPPQSCSPPSNPPWVVFRPPPR